MAFTIMLYGRTGNYVSEFPLGETLLHLESRPQDDDLSVREGVRADARAGGWFPANFKELL
ncbi:hypothetical protein HK405_014134, partial [Cladochytrium tenue]